MILTSLKAQEQPRTFHFTTRSSNLAMNKNEGSDLSYFLTKAQRPESSYLSPEFGILATDPVQPQFHRHPGQLSLTESPCGLTRCLVRMHSNWRAVSTDRKSQRPKA